MTDWYEPDFEQPAVERIPIGRTIAHAYDFAFRGFFRILSVMWLPYVCLIAGIFVVGMLNPDGLAKGVGSQKMAGPKDAIIFLAFMSVASIMLFIQVEGVIREALGQRSGMRFFYFSLGKSVWLLTAALITTTLLLIVAICAVFFVIGAAGAAIRATGGALETTADAKIGIGIAAGIGLTVLFCSVLYVAIRQFFLLAPVVVVEKQLGIRRAWKLGDGNFWSMLTIYLAVMAPLGIANFMILFAMPKLLGSAASIQDTVAGVRYIWFLLPYFLVFSTLLYGLVYGAQTFAYRALVPGEKPEDVF